MRIGIDARFYGPDSKGLGRYTQKLIAHMEKIDQENDYIIFLRRDNYDTYVPQNSRFRKVLADFQWYSFSEQIFFPFVLYKHRCDLVHFLHFNVPILYVKRLIVTIHDLILLRYPTRKASTRNRLFYWIKFLCYRIVIASAVAKAWKIIAVSQFTKTDICAQYPRTCKKTTVIYEAAEVIDQKLIDYKEFFARYDIMKPYMLYVGNAYPHKNLYNLVDAFALYVKNGGAVSRMVLVGRDDYFYTRLEEHITSHEIENIIILYTIDDAQLHALYRQATMFVFPSLYEGFGLPPLEAQLLKVPVLSSDHPCMKEILSEQGAMFVDASDVPVFAQAMEDIVSDTVQRNRLIVDGYENARKYSWRKMAIQIHNIYTKK
ncbi:MAG: glycosyltransferase family 1 protein [Parcubacteria group bacterium]|jgi:glycosyltransferase involved in cell wall biosynthesis